MVIKLVLIAGLARAVGLRWVTGVQAGLLLGAGENLASSSSAWPAQSI